MMMMMMIKLRTSRYLDVSQLLALLPSLLWSVTVVRTKFRPDTVGAPCQLVHRCSLSRNGTQPSPQRLDTLSNNIVPNISLSRHFSYIFSYKCETNLPPFCWAEDHCMIQYVFKNDDVLGGLLYAMVAQMPAFGIQMLQIKQGLSIQSSWKTSHIISAHLADLSR